MLASVVVSILTLFVSWVGLWLALARALTQGCLSLSNACGVWMVVCPFVDCSSAPNRRYVMIEPGTPSSVARSL